MDIRTYADTTGVILAAWIAVSMTLLVGGRIRRRKREGSGSAASRHGPARLYDLARGLYRHFEESAQPADVEQYPQFNQAVEILNDPLEGYTTQDLLTYAGGDNAIIACMALAALERRWKVQEVDGEIVANLNRVPLWTRFFALRALDRHTPAERGVIGPVVLKADGAWLSPLGLQILKDFVVARLEKGETPAFAAGLQDVGEERGVFLLHLLEQLAEARLQPLLTELEHWQRTRIDVDFLNSVGKVWTLEEARQNPILEHAVLRQTVLELEAALTQQEVRSLLLVGEAGVGKTTAVRCLAARLLEAGWVVFEATGSDLIAGQIFVGALEERLRRLVRALGDKRHVLWFVPEFHDLYWAGRTVHNDTSALDTLLPHIEQGRLVVLGETRRLEPLPEAGTLELARAWGRSRRREGQPELLSEITLREAWNLTQQYLGDQAAPGNLMKLLDLTRMRLEGGLAAQEGARGTVLGVDDLIVTLTQLTGLPVSILDERHSMDLAALRALFERRVLGQAEAVDCLVQRVAMIKAGVTDPTRPLGVFLFAGPTGTGKTEIAKTLAEFLFGSPNRMHRIDMSELQTQESLSRLLGNPEARADGALVDQIRKQPFSVVLLDEFEKAHPNVWDLFLQVFDDGRLTDRAGNTADFRHAIIIMTSNLGGVIPSGTSLGFAREGGTFRRHEVEKAITKAFRREFLNRIDQVVIFNPLSVETMRAILHKELEEVTRRRGLRSRTWAIEWGDDAIEFLLQKGFTADLGARPLKRAIERYLLAPLAVTIVTHEYPQGDQFLFVRTEGDHLVVQFVDPDAMGAEARVATPEPAAAVAPAPEGEPGEHLERIASSPHGVAAEVESLGRHYLRLQQAVDETVWQERKQELLAQTGRPGFWQSEERFRLLGEVEYMDRLERVLRRSGSLLERLRGSSPGQREYYPRDLVGRVAQQLYLLSAAQKGIRERLPRDAFVLVEAGREVERSPEETNRFAARIGVMYRSWGKKRGMQLDVVEEWGGDGTRPYHLVLGLSGFGAYSILRPEAGLHVLEIPRGEGNGMQRCRVRVQVVPQPDEPARDAVLDLRRQAAAAFQGAPTAKLEVVRRYRETPPLVRDRVRGWRSGRLERVLGGDFDLILPTATDRHGTAGAS